MDTQEAEGSCPNKMSQPLAQFPNLSQFAALEPLTRTVAGSAGGKARQYQGKYTQ